MQVVISHPVISILDFVGYPHSRSASISQLQKTAIAAKGIGDAQCAHGGQTRRDVSRESDSDFVRSVETTCRPRQQALAVDNLRLRRTERTERIEVLHWELGVGGAVRIIPRGSQTNRPSDPQEHGQVSRTGAGTCNGPADASLDPTRTISRYAA